jgi:hypothetical protein
MTTEPLEALDPQETFRGYDHSVLEQHFNLVRPELHWKAPIEAVVPPGTDLNCLESAIIYFTGSSGEFIKKGDSTVVIAPGYWSTQG